MLGISNSLRHELAMQGFATKRVEAVLTHQNEFDFMTLCIRFCKEFETDSKLRQLAKRMTLNEYVAQTFPRLIGGRREEIEAKIDHFLSLLDLWSQSQVIELYKWIFDINPRINTVLIHNKIIDRFKHLDPEFMDTQRKSLKNVSFPFKDMIDVVGKFIHDKSLRVFIENVETGQKIKRGGIQDRKVPAILLIKSALEAEYEVGGQRSQSSQAQDKIEPRFIYNQDKRNYVIKSKNTDEMQPKAKSSAEPWTEARLDAGQFTDEDIDNIPDIDHIFDDSEGYQTSKPSVHDLTKIAHKYVFGNNETMQDVKDAIAKGLVSTEEEQLTTNDLLQKDIKALEEKFEAAQKRHQTSDDLYQLVLSMFTENKQNYYTLGKEIGSIAKLTDFLMEVYEESSPENMKTLKGIKYQEVIELKKLKLLIGKCFEKTSEDALYDFQRVFKFAIDYTDYENDILKGDKGDQIFDLLQKSPPVPDQKGLRNARAKIREFKEFDFDSPVRERTLRSLEGDDVEVNELLQQSAYYGDSKAGPARLEFQEASRTEQTTGYEDDLLLGYKIPSVILDGMTKLLVRKYAKPILIETSKIGAKRKSIKSRSVSLDSKKAKSKSSKKSSKKSKSKSKSKSRSPSKAKSSTSKKSGKVLRKKSTGKSKAKKSQSKGRSKSASSKKSKKTTKSASKASVKKPKSKSRSPSVKSKASKSIKKKPGIKKRVKKSKKPIKKTAEYTAPISVNSENLHPDQVMSFQPREIDFEEDEATKSAKKKRSWRDDDPVFKSRASSRGISIDHELDDLVSNRHKISERSQMQSVEKSNLNQNEKLLAAATSRQEVPKAKKKIVKKKKPKGSKSRARSKSSTKKSTKRKSASKKKASGASKSRSRSTKRTSARVSSKSIKAGAAKKTQGVAKKPSATNLASKTKTAATAKPKTTGKLGITEAGGAGGIALKTSVQPGKSAGFSIMKTSALSKSPTPSKRKVGNYKA